MLINQKILCVFPIFAPNQYFFEKCMKSISSFSSYLKTLQGRDLDILYGGWVLSDNHYSQINDFIKTEMPTAQLFRFDKNYGKAFFVNSMVSHYHDKNKDTTYGFTCDNDIIFDGSERFFFDRLLIGVRNIEQASKRPVGLIGINQKEENCHWIDKMNTILSYKIEEHNINEDFVRSADGQGIAGGALFFNLKGFISFGGYRSFVSPYCGDDAFLELDYRQRGFITCVMKSLSVIHPVTVKNEDYIEWKKSVIGNWNIPFDNDLYIKNVDSSMEFWKNHQE